MLTAPSGTGKTSLVRALLEKIDNIELSISYTTRPPRPGDIQNRDYHFISADQFKQMLDNNLFLESATIYHNQYGTSKPWVMERLTQGKDILLEIDWQGAQQIRRQFPKAILIFVLPPSLPILKERLQNRRQDLPSVIAERMACAQEEISHCNEFDYLVANDQFEKALADLEHIIIAEGLKCRVQMEENANLLARLLEK